MITIKTKEEIAILREGGKRHAKILQTLGSMVKPGITAKEIDDEAVRLIKEGGDKAAFLNFKPYGADRPFPGSVCISVNDEIVHGIPNEGEKILKNGDIVTIDLGLVHKGLFTDSAITVPVGDISKDVQDLLDATKKALDAGIKRMRPGIVGDGLGCYIINFIGLMLFYYGFN
jgi:methionyl aminopeptidase